MITGLQIALLLSVIAAIYAWERWRVRKIHKEGAANRRQTRALFRNLRRLVEEAHDYRRG